jgi:CDP-glucose 4,6-dehydratase
LESLDIPYETFYTNSVGTLNVLESVRKLCPNIGAVVVASSDKSYGELESDSYTENHPLNGTYPYDASKSITDIICKSYRKTYELPVATIRSCNVYGIGDLNRGRILPALIESFLSGKPFEIRNGGFDKREYIHAEDSARAYIEIAKYINNSGKEGSFNVASGEVFSVLDIVNMFEEAVGEKINKVFTGGKTKEIGSQVLDFSLIIKETNWTPEKKIKDNIPKIIDWYREQKKQLEKSGF